MQKIYRHIIKVDSCFLTKRKKNYTEEEERERKKNWTKIKNLLLDRFIFIKRTLIYCTSLLYLVWCSVSICLNSRVVNRLIHVTSFTFDLMYTYINIFFLFRVHFGMTGCLLPRDNLKSIHHQIYLKYGLISWSQTTFLWSKHSDFFFIFSGFKYKIRTHTWRLSKHHVKFFCYCLMFFMKEWSNLHYRGKNIILASKQINMCWV